LNRSPAYCFLDKKKRLKRHGGNLTLYSLGNLKPGDVVCDRFPFLDENPVGHDEKVVIPSVAVTPSVYADVHIIGCKTGLWIAFLDATSQVERCRSMQQRANETNLLRERLARITDQLKRARNTIVALKNRLASAEKTPGGP